MIRVRLHRPAVGLRPARRTAVLRRAQDLVAPVVHGPGNVLATRQEHNGLRGEQGNALLGIAANLAEVVRRRVGGRS